jgi:nucleoid-associated protein YgaU
VGALVFYDWGGDGQADHVGIVTKVGKTSIKSLEGNTTKGGARNWVAEVTRQRNKTILGYGYVDVGKARRTYTVRSGDSLSGIAKVYDTTWQKLYAENKDVIGSKASLITPGMVLDIP